MEIHSHWIGKYIGNFLIDAGDLIDGFIGDFGKLWIDGVCIGAEMCLE